MTPVSLCLQHVDRLTAVPDGTVAARLDHALDELERAYRKPSERVVALEAVWQGIDRDPHRSLSALAHFVCAIVERRQSRWAAWSDLLRVWPALCVTDSSHPIPSS